MSDRERTDAGTFAETVSLDDVLGVFDAVRGPVITSSDVADALGCTTEAARQKLTRLYDRGEVDKRKTGRTVVYWRVDDSDDESGREPVETTPGATADRSPSPDARDVAALEDGAEDPVGDALAGWEPDTDANAKSARAQTRRTVEYLRDHAPERFQAGELKDALAGESSFSPRHWWERAVQPGLKYLADAGLVEYRAGHHDYRWGEDGDDPLDGEVYDPTEEF